MTKSVLTRKQNALDVFFLLHEQYRDYREEPAYTEIVKPFEHSGRLGRREEYVFQRRARQFLADPSRFLTECVKERFNELKTALQGEALQVWGDYAELHEFLIQLGIPVAIDSTPTRHHLLPGTALRHGPPKNLPEESWIHPFPEDFFLQEQTDPCGAFLDMLETDILWRVHVFQPDLLVWGPTYPSDQPENPRPEFLRKLRDFSPRTRSYVQWWDHDEDDPELIEFEKQSLRWADMVGLHDSYTRFLRIRQQEGMYADYPDARNLHWHPTVFDPGEYRRLNMEKQFDIAIFGSAENERVKFIEFLGDQYGDRFHHFGSLQNASLHLPLRDYVRRINQTRIFVNTQTYDHRIQFKGKVREAMSCGTFILEEANPETAAFAPEGTGYVFFQGMEDLEQKIDYYLKNETKRQAIADKGHTWYHRHHGPRQWVDTLHQSACATHPKP